MHLCFFLLGLEPAGSTFVFLFLDFLSSSSSSLASSLPPGELPWPAVDLRTFPDVACFFVLFDDSFLLDFFVLVFVVLLDAAATGFLDVVLGLFPLLSITFFFRFSRR